MVTVAQHESAELWELSLVSKSFIGEILLTDENTDEVT